MMPLQRKWLLVAMNGMPIFLSFLWHDVDKTKNDIGTQQSTREFYKLYLKMKKNKNKIFSSWFSFLYFLSGQAYTLDTEPNDD